jgi:hypothetical protein
MTEEELHKALSDLKKKAGITKDTSSPSPLTTSGSKNGEYMRKHNIKPGTEEWFKLWFARPGMTGEKPTKE